MLLHITRLSQNYTTPPTPPGRSYLLSLLCFYSALLLFFFGLTKKTLCRLQSTYSKKKKKIQYQISDHLEKTKSTKGSKRERNTGNIMLARENKQTQMSPPVEEINFLQLPISEVILDLRSMLL